MHVDVEALSDSAVTAAALRRLRPLGRPRAVARDEVMVRAGEPVTDVFLVQSGRFIGFLPIETGLEVPVDEVMHGCLLGLPGLFTDGRHPFTVRAVAAGEVAAIDGAELRRHAERDAELALLLVALLSVRLRECIGAAGEMKLRTVRQRTAAYLLRLAPHGRPGPVEVRLPMPKKLLAAHLGMTQQSFSRVLRNLRAAGVTVRGRLATIADPPSLAALASAEDAA